MGVLAGVAPIVGTTRVVAAAGGMVKALGAAVELAELAQYADADERLAPRRRGSRPLAGDHRPQERLNVPADAVRVVGERPVPAVLEDRDLRARERRALALGHHHRDIRIVRSPHHERGAI